MDSEEIIMADSEYTITCKGPRMESSAELEFLGMLDSLCSHYPGIERETTLILHKSLAIKDSMESQVA